MIKQLLSKLLFWKKKTRKRKSLDISDKKNKEFRSVVQMYIDSLK